MSTGISPSELQQAGAWLTERGLTDAQPTPMLAMRLAVRRRARIADSLILAALIIVAALALTYERLPTSALGGFQPHRAAPLLFLAAGMVILLLGRSMVDRWVRRVDRRAAATLSRRAAHPLKPGWRALLGLPYAVFAAATFAAAALLAVGALIVGDSTVRYAALILLVGLISVTVGNVVQLRALLARPVVAEDELSLTADVVMRVEDARELTAPHLAWTLPMVLIFGTAPGWWNVAAIASIALGLIGLILLQKRSPTSVAMARQAMISQ
ncbi:hypothetical protein F4553_001642 [Allocatelliglobosispora scoriae]|uniref:Uncharacterized protein n=1 Tax=Allocatelliglobosispora scoriae TaxID=643052 RepID=A0A841BMR3_9ACTN|nr:hypothetical protein [Allocatelliglobosispora scoriae]MBB5868263.1 hypothetical protein [Allocatelliglobosispora scoriae]